VNLDSQLRDALRREAAPPDLAATVLARVALVRRRVPRRKRSVWPLTLALAAAIAVMALIPPFVSRYRRHEDERAQQAKVQLLTALKITGAQLRQVSEKIRRNTRRTL
jgi:hypothetical protein